MGVRLRLTAIYGGLFVLAGLFLVSVNFVLVRQNVPRRITLSSTFDSPFIGRTEMEARRMVLLQDPRTDIARVQAAVEDYRDDTLQQLVVQSAIALALTAVVATGLGWIIAGRVLRPVHDITAAARRLSEQNLHERLNLTGPHDELRELGDTFDQMLERLDSAFESQSRFAANAAHELRTPLAVLRTELEVAQRDPDTNQDELRAMVDRLHGVVRRTEHLIDGLLALARGQRGLRDRHAVDLADVAAEAVDDLRAELHGLALDTDLQPAPASGDPGLLAHLAANLVANAARHNIEGGWVSITTRPEGRGALLVVTNSGTTVPPDEVDALFEPFRRLGAERTSSATGAGLGLSIVKAVTDAHGGTVTLEPQAGGGLRVTVALPGAG